MRIGDVVKLKSGGLKMTVAWVSIEFDVDSGSHNVDCHWMLRGEFRSAKFDERELVRVRTKP